MHIHLTCSVGVQDSDAGGDVSQPSPSSSEHRAVPETKCKATHRPRRDRRRPAVTSAGSQSSVSTAAACAGDDLANPVRDLVARIYEEELRKLMSAAQLKGNALDATMYDREIKRLSFLRAGGPLPKQSPSSPSTDGAGQADDKENVGGVASEGLEDAVTTEDDMPQDLSVGRQKVASEAPTPDSVVHLSLIHI